MCIVCACVCVRACVHVMCCVCVSACVCFWCECKAASSISQWLATLAASNKWYFYIYSSILYNIMLRDIYIYMCVCTVPLCWK